MISGGGRRLQMRILSVMTTKIMSMHRESMAVSAAGPSSNWAKLKATIIDEPRHKEKGKGRAKDAREIHTGKRKRRNGPGGVARYVSAALDSASAGPSRIALEAPSSAKEEVVLNPVHDYSPLVVELREMIAGRNALNDAQRAPGKYVAVDCEMVGLGHLGSESALARVSLINFHGHILLDSFVATRETVTDLRTWVSGVKASDLVGAPTFEEVQKQVAGIVKGKILVGHAVANDLKALLLDHPGPMLRDTQKCPALRERAKTKLPSLRKLTEMELGVAIQKGAHSSVTDARATMALYRLHKHTWEASLRHSTEAWMAKNRKRKPEEIGAEEGQEIDRTEDNARDLGTVRKRRNNGDLPPRNGKTGISSGLGKIVKVGKQRLEGKGERRNAGAHGSVKTVTGDRWWESHGA